MSYIYKITNLINNKTYVGQRRRSTYRDEKYMGSSLLLRDAFKKYGKEKQQENIFLNIRNNGRN